MENIDDICKKYNLNEVQIEDLSICLDIHSNTLKILNGEYITKFKSYGPDYFALKLKEGKSRVEIYEKIRAEAVQFGFDEKMRKDGRLN